MYGCNAYKYELAESHTGFYFDINLFLAIIIAKLQNAVFLSDKLKKT